MCPVKLKINGSLLPRNTDNLKFEPTPPKWLVALNQRLRPLGPRTSIECFDNEQKIDEINAENHSF